MKHAELVLHARRYLLELGCSVVLTEMKAVTETGEIPDAYGSKQGISIVIECKVSKKDADADKKKPFRIHPELGMGQFRFFMTPDGLLKPGDVPTCWGLLIVSGDVVHMEDGPRGDVESWLRVPYWRHGRRNVQAELALMTSAYRRLSQSKKQEPQPLCNNPAQALF